MNTGAPSTLKSLLASTPYEAYTYAYPHKTAYHAFPQPLTLSEVWSAEPRESLFLYFHIPFCEMRCGFCNLFTTTHSGQSLIDSYVAALQRQAEAFRRSVPDASFARIAFGGGTPTFLPNDALETLLQLVRRMAGGSSIPFSVEASPATAEPEKLKRLREFGVDRISLGVQSFVDAETNAAGRRQTRSAVERALKEIRSSDYPILNLDLIYGLPGQTMETWLNSLQAALAWTPEELFLYPLYVRPLTGLGRAGRLWQDSRLEFYRAGRDLLLAHGYHQVSMRMFRKPQAAGVDAPAYCAQEDGMLGLGCGARSYTRRVHYSTRFAVGAVAVRNIIAEYCARSSESFGFTNYGFILDDDEQRRRYLSLTLLNASGLDLDAYESRFGSEVFRDFPEMIELIELDLGVIEERHLRLTPNGLECSDTIGPWLASSRVKNLAKSFLLQ